MTKNGPDDEVSFGLELSETGVTGKAKGRALSVFQRWFGSALAPVIARNNRAAARERLFSAFEQKALQQVGAEALERLRSNTDAVDGLLESLELPGAKRRRENTDAVFERAIEDLRNNPPSDEDASSGNEEITPEIADRLELYAAGATTEEVRERWGRVLAAEIRNPGTFSLKVLRIIDELDGHLPAVFEALASDRLVEGCIPHCLSATLSYGNQIDLVDAGLLHDPGGAGDFQIRMFVPGFENQKEVWLFSSEDVAISVPKDDRISALSAGRNEPIVSSKGTPAIPAFVLTSAGRAIVSILPPVDNAGRYFSLLRAKIPESRLWRRSHAKAEWIEHDPLPSQPDIVENQ